MKRSSQHSVLYRLRTLGCVAFLLCLTSCVKKGHFRLKGSFTGLRQAELYVYSVDGGQQEIDTIRIIESEFDWEEPLERECTYYIIFPNLSEHVVFAQPGTCVTVKGDGSHLRALEITGTEANETLTAFRLQHLTENTSQQIKAMKAFVHDNPNSVVSGYFRRQINIQERRLSRLEIGTRLPKVTILPDADSKDTIFLPDTNKQERTLLVFWASWKRDSRSAFMDIRKAYKRTRKAKYRRLHPISISLDSDTSTYHYSCRVDSIPGSFNKLKDKGFDTRCTGEIWQTPIVDQLAIRDLPYYILTDSLGTILALGNNWKKDIEPKL